jgi:cholest-4-en-3-one 26-monooxygenase
VSILVGANDSGMLGTFDQKLAGHDDAQLALANNELIMLLVVLLVAGNETTRNALSGSMQLLIENPGERQKVIDRPELLPVAVEEMVRLVSPVHAHRHAIRCSATKLEAGSGC